MFLAATMETHSCAQSQTACVERTRSSHPMEPPEQMVCTKLPPSAQSQYFLWEDTCAPLLALMRLLVSKDMDWVCIPGQLGATATWGIAISAICLLALLVFGAMRFMKPRRLLKTSKTAQGMVWHKELRKEDGE